MKTRIKFWKKDTGNFMSFSQGLSQQELDFFKSLKIGDRLILWEESRSKKTDSHPDLSLALYVKKEQL